MLGIFLYLIILESNTYKNVCSIDLLGHYNDFQINKCIIYAVSILKITYLPYAIIKAASFLNYFLFTEPMCTNVKNCLIDQSYNL